MKFVFLIMIIIIEKKTSYASPLVVNIGAGIISECHQVSLDLILYLLVVVFGIC